MVSRTEKMVHIQTGDARISSSMAALKCAYAQRTKDPDNYAICSFKSVG